MNQKVAIVEIQDNDYKSALSKGLKLIDFNIQVLRKRNILLKPNLCCLEPPEIGTTTDVRLIESVVKMIHNIDNHSIAIAESSHWIATADEEFERLNYKTLGKRYNVSLINISKSSSYKVLLNGKHFKTLRVPKHLLKYDFFISLPKLKRHPQCYITCALKNQFGMNPQRYKSSHHPYLSQAIYDLNTLYKPDLVIVDGNYVAVGENRSIKAGLLIVGQDAAMVDYVVALMFGIEPKQVPYLKYYSKHNGGLSRPEIMGKRMEECYIKTKFQKPYSPTWLYRCSNFLIRMGDKIGKPVSNFGKFLLMVSEYLWGVPIQSIFPKILQGYKEWKNK